VNKDVLEIPQGDRFPPLRFGVAKVVYYCLAHDLAPAIRTVRLQTCRLGDGDVRRCAVYGRRRGVDHARAVVVGHDLEEGDGGGDIVLVIGERDLSRLSYSFVGLRSLA
jgi:hypothetical protein